MRLHGKKIPPQPCLYLDVYELTQIRPMDLMMCECFSEIRFLSLNGPTEGWALWEAPGKQHGSQAPLWHSSHSYPFLAHSIFCFHFGHMDFPGGWGGEESACNVGDLGSIPGLGRSPGEGNGYLLQYSGLENAMDRIVHGVTKSGTWLSNFHFHFHSTHLSAIDSKLLQRKNPIWWIFMFLASPIFNRYSCTRRIKTEGCG